MEGDSAILSHVPILLNAPLTSEAVTKLSSVINSRDTYEFIIQSAIKLILSKPDDLYKKPSNCRAHGNRLISYTSGGTTNFAAKQEDHTNAMKRLFKFGIEFSTTTVEREMRKIHYELDGNGNIYGDPPKELSPAACPETSTLLLPIIQAALQKYKISEEKAIGFTSHGATFCADVTAFLSVFFGKKVLQCHATFEEYNTTQYKKQPLSLNSWFLNKQQESERTFSVHEYVATDDWKIIIQKYYDVIKTGKKIGKKIIIVEDPCGNDFDDIIVSHMAEELFEEVIHINTIYGPDGKFFMDYILGL